MRIDRLEIRSPWKNLEGLDLNLDQDREVAVLLGRNGSAKSNLLEALIYIFRNIDLKRTAAFSYSIAYFMKGKRVVVEASVGEQPRCTVDQQKVKLDILRGEYTPRYVVGYYSGTSNRFEELFWPHDLKARALTLPKAGKEPPKGPLEMRRFIYSRPEHGLFALLAFYFSTENQTRSFLRNVLRIEGFDSALLILKKPNWGKDGLPDDMFWGAKGEVFELLKAWYAESLAPFRVRTEVQQSFAHKPEEDLQYLYLPNVDALKRVAEPYTNDPRAFFQALDSMRLSELMQGLRVRVKVTGADRAIHTRELSEGEQQLLTVLGLMRFTRNEESLYLLDEPDTHLNPAWGVNYLDWLRKIGQIYQNSHTVLATHDPLLVAGLVKEEIRVLHRGVNGGVTTVEPDDSPRGWGVAGVLTSELFGLESQLDAYSLKVLKLVYRASFIEEKARREKYLSLLRPLLPSLETIESSPDPYRNVAKDAYLLAVEKARSLGNEGIDREQVIDRLAENLYEGAVGAK